MKAAVRSVVVLDHPPGIGLDRDLVPPETELIDAGGLGRAEVRHLCRHADVIVTDTTPVGADLIAEAGRCRLICEFGVGIDNIDVAAATAAGMYVSRVPAYCVEELAEHALALVLASTRGIVRFHDGVRRGLWDHRQAGRLYRTRGRTLGIVGLGHVGAALAARAAPLGYRILATDPAADAHARRDLPIEPVALPRLLAEADVVSLHAPLTPATRGLIDADGLASMKPTAYLVNTARGGLVDQPALLAALRAGRIAGAALDVLATEPPRDGEALLDLPNVIVTPHAGFYSEESMRDLVDGVFTEVRAVLRGESPRNAVNRPAVRPPAG